MSMSPRKAVGMTVGALWLIGVSAGFAAFALVMIDTPWATTMLLAMLGLTVVLIWIGVGNIRAVLRLPGGLPAREPIEQWMMRRFAWIVGAEVVAFAVVNGICGATQRFILIPALDLIVIGIHFLPLAPLFGVPRYYPLGVAFCVIPALVLALVPQTAHIGSVQAWWVLPSLGCGFVAFVVAIGSLREVRRFINHGIAATVTHA